tara:strand:+ start:1618 stop:2832 length:1215 start_codon:yes stop_codon:yes gene_type:complete
MGLLGNKNFSEIDNEYKLKKEVVLENLDITTTDQKITTVKESKIRRNDNLFLILKRLGISNENILEIVNSKNSKLLSSIEYDDIIQVEINETNKIIKLKYKDNFKEGVMAILDGDVYNITRYEEEIEKIYVYKKVVIQDSMYMSGLREGIPESVIMDLAYINGWDIDFTHDIRPGDNFSLIYEEIFVNGQKVAIGDILISEFENQGKNYIAIRYDSISGDSDYFTPEGINVKKAFLRSPVQISYISSKYNLKRKHPILHTIRAHKGVDYAANRGSPVRATGDGTISFAESNGGCGNEIKIKHSEDYETRYCHLDKFHPKSKVGSKVKQGDTIGYVGSTGLATGPHLHYEFHVNGKHTNPLTVKFPNSRPISISEKDLYLEVAKDITYQLRNYQSITEKGGPIGG